MQVTTNIVVTSKCPHNACGRRDSAVTLHSNLSAEAQASGLVMISMYGDPRFIAEQIAVMAPTRPVVGKLRALNAMMVALPRYPRNSSKSRAFGAPLHIKLGMTLARLKMVVSTFFQQLLQASDIAVLAIAVLGIAVLIALVRMV
jgi:hypothetical protein